MNSFIEKRSNLGTQLIYIKRYEYLWIAGKSYDESESIKTWLPVMKKVSCILWLLMIYSTHSGFESSSKFHLYARLCIYIYIYTVYAYIYIHIWGFKIMVPQTCYTHPYLQMLKYMTHHTSLMCGLSHGQIPQLAITGTNGCP